MLEDNEANICSPVDCVFSFICTCYPTQRCEIGQELTSLKLKETYGHYELFFLTYGLQTMFLAHTQYRSHQFEKKLPSWTSQTLCYSGGCSHY